MSFNTGEIQVFLGLNGSQGGVLCQFAYQIQKSLLPQGCHNVPYLCFSRGEWEEQLGQPEVAVLQLLVQLTEL